MEIGVENCPGMDKKSEAKSHGHIPQDTRQMLNGSGYSFRSMQEMSDPISTLVWVIDLPDGLIIAVIRAIGGMKEWEAEKVGASWVGPSWERSEP